MKNQCTYIIKKHLANVIQSVAVKTGSTIPVSYNPCFNSDGSLNVLIHAQSNFKLEIYQDGKILSEGREINIEDKLFKDLKENPRIDGFKCIPEDSRKFGVISDS